MVGLMACAVSVAVHLASLGSAMVDTWRIRSVADATALAGVVGGREVAERIARENGTTLVVFEVDGGTASAGPAQNDSGTVRVVVESGSGRASAWASNAP